MNVRTASQMVSSAVESSLLAASAHGTPEIWCAMVQYKHAGDLTIGGHVNLISGETGDTDAAEQYRIIGMGQAPEGWVLVVGYPSECVSTQAPTLTNRMLVRDTCPCPCE